MIAVAPSPPPSPVDELLALPRLWPLPSGPETRVKGFDPFAAPRVGVLSAESSDLLLGIGRRYDGLVTGVTLYANGDPVNSSDPSGHDPHWQDEPTYQAIHDPVTDPAAYNPFAGTSDAGDASPTYVGGSGSRHAYWNWSLPKSHFSPDSADHAAGVSFRDAHPTDTAEAVAVVQVRSWLQQHIPQGGGLGALFGGVSSGARTAWSGAQSATGVTWDQITSYAGDISNVSQSWSGDIRDQAISYGGDIKDVSQSWSGDIRDQAISYAGDATAVGGAVVQGWKDHNPFRSRYHLGQFALGGATLAVGSGLTWLGVSGTVELAVAAPDSLGLSLLALPAPLAAVAYGTVLTTIVSPRFFGNAFGDDSNG